MSTRCGPGRLIADVGGTNVRFAMVCQSGVPENLACLPVARYSDFTDAVADYVENTGVCLASIEGMAIAVAVAGPVRSGKVSMTNAPWHLSEADLSVRFGNIPVRLINDVAAVAHALPVLGERQCQVVSAGQQDEQPMPMLAINVGTGLGAAVAIPTDTGWIALPTEAGHVRFGAANLSEMALLEHSETFEDLLAGPGWQRFEGASGDAVARRSHLPDTATTYSSVLGRFAGDATLATGAWGGVFFCGGVLDGWDGLIDEAVLIRYFHDHGAMTELLQRVPVYRIMAENPALIGLTRLPF